ncbi:MAG: hypothetical protein HYX96_09305 [Chloroflexi bacterium]|nr:hypothetical protein [Chloroflexota bacterium]
MEEKVVRKLVTSIKCDVCGQTYRLANIKVIGHHEELWFFRVRCASCQAQCLVAAIVQRKESAALGDLTEAETASFKPVLVGVDDVLDMHNFLLDFDGDFAGLFSRA